MAKANGVTVDGEITVLDHGFARLVDHMGDDLAVVRAARQSFDAVWRTGEDEGSDTRLINYLMRNRHSTPFEAVEFQFQVRAPLFVFRQWTRHRTWKYLTINEVSARYTELVEQFYVPKPGMVGEPSKTNKQARQLADPSEPVPENRVSEVAAYEQSCIDGFRTYHQLLEAGWPREVARAVLPLATFTTMSVKVDLHNLLHFIDLRSWEGPMAIPGQPPGAQFEIKVYADALRELIRPVVPVCVTAWEASG